MFDALVGVAIVSSVFFLAIIVMRALARIPFIWIFPSANTFSLVVPIDEKSGEVAKKGGADIHDIIHAVPGKLLDDKMSRDYMQWEFIEGVEPRGFLYRNFGIEYMGVLKTVRTNLDKRRRYTRELDSAESYKTMSKDKLVKFVFYSGELTIEIRGADTNDGLGIDLDFDLIFERQFPARSVLRLADAPAYLTSMAEEIVNGITGKHSSSDYFQGPNIAKNKKDIADAIQTNPDFMSEALRELGLKITSVNLRSVSMPEEQQKLLQRKIDAQTKAEEELILAEKDKKKKILANDAEADHVTRVISPIAANANSVRVREAEAYEKNETVTTFAPGQGAGIGVFSTPPLQK